MDGWIERFATDTYTAEYAERKRIDDPAHLAEGTLAGFYRVPMLVALGNPYSQSLQGQEVLWRLAQYHAADCWLAAGNGQGSEFPAVPRDEDVRALERIRRAPSRRMPTSWTCRWKSFRTRRKCVPRWTGLATSIWS
jgi:hypothetical protein